MDKECITFGREAKCTQNVCKESRREEATSST